jgi:hypothetical protein
MVFRRDDKGGGWHEPPYTWEEEMELYRRMNAGPMTIYYGSRGPDGKLKRTSDKQGPTEEPLPNDHDGSR